MRSGGTAAEAYVCGDREHPGLRGRVWFIPQADGVLVEAEIWGLPAEPGPGFFGFHIHEGGNCGGKGFANAGGHFNPGGQEHPRHAGDLPPLLGCGGRAYLAVKTNRFRIGEIIGRTVVIHSRPDDFRTQPSGDSGSRIACGVIHGL